MDVNKASLSLRSHPGGQMPSGSSPRIADFVVGETVTTFLALRGKQMREQNGRPFIRFEFTDRTGRIMAVVGEDVSAFWESADENDVVKLRATVGTWNEKKTLRIQRLRRARPDEYNPADFVPVYPGDRETLWEEFLRRAHSVEHTGLRALLERAVAEPGMKERLLAAPGGKLWHHTYMGGLLEHTNAVAALVEVACARYPLAHRDLATTGALLHDVGKIEAFDISTTIEYSDAGRLIGHVVLGERMVRAWCERTPELEEPLRDLLCHIVLAHERCGDQRSPVEPMTLEAALVASANELDATAGAFTRILEREREGGQAWSAWVNTLQRHIYLPPAEET